MLQPAKRTPLKTSQHQISKTQRTENKTTDVVIQQHSRKLLMTDILMSETCWAHKKWNKTASDIKLVFHSSTITTMHGPINIRFLQVSQQLAQSSNGWCEGRGGRQADGLLSASCVPVLQRAVCRYCSLTVWLALERSSGGGFVSGGTGELPFLQTKTFLPHTQNSHVLHFPVELKVLGKSRKGGNINCIVLHRALFLSYLNDQRRSIALVKFLLDFLKVITTAAVCLAPVIDS